MKNSIRLKLNNLRTSSTVKHLRGRHDQRDHAWNRGMGRGDVGGRLGPGYMNESQFRAFVKSLDESVAAGDMTQEENDTIRESVRAAHNQAYDKRINEELSRRESTVETLANRRRNRNIPKRISANDLTMTAENFKFANANMYAGTGFLSHWNNIGATDIGEALTQERESLDKKYVTQNSWGPTEDFEWLMRPKYATFRGIAKIVNGSSPTPITYGASLAEIYNDGPEGPQGDLFTMSVLFRRINGLFNNPDQHIRSGFARTPSELFEKAHEMINEFEERYKILSEMDWNPSEEDMQQLREQSPSGSRADFTRARLIDNVRQRNPEELTNLFKKSFEQLEFLKQLIQPSVLYALNDISSSVQPINYMNELSSNSSTLFDDWQTFMTGLLQSGGMQANPENIKGIIAAFELYNNVSKNGIMQADILEKLWSEAMTIPRLNSMAGTAAESTNPLDQFTIPVIEDGNSNTRTYNDSATRDFRNVLREYVLNDIQNKMGRPMQFAGTPEERELGRESFKNNLEAYYSSLVQYKNKSEDTTAIINEITTSFMNKFYEDVLGYSITDQKLLHQEMARKYNVEEFIDYLTEDLDIKEEEQTIAALDFGDRLPRTIELNRRKLEIARNSGADRDRIRDLERKLDDSIWNLMVYQDGNLDTQVEETDLERRLYEQTDMAPSTRSDLEAELDLMRENRRNRVETNRRFAVQNEDSDYYLDYVESYIESRRIDGMVDEVIAEDLADEAEEFQNDYPDLDTSAGLRRASEMLNRPVGGASRLDFTDVDWDSFAKIQKEAWGERTPITITESTPIGPDDTVFGSPAYAYGNEILDTMNNTNPMPPDNPAETPLFNPRSARFGAREIIEGKDADPKSIFVVDDSRKELELALDDLGYDSDLIKTIIDNMNDSLIPGPRSDFMRPSVYVRKEGNNGVRVSIGFTCGMNGGPYYSSGDISIFFAADKSKSNADLHVGYLAIPEFVGPVTHDPVTGKENPRPNNKYKGAAGPVLMRAADQLRKITYPLGAKRTVLTAQAANIHSRGNQQNSGPSTWPVLGGTAPVSVNKKLAGRLLSMGYSREFVESVIGKTVPSSLFFLNTPPYIYILDDKKTDGTTIKVKSTPQTLWNEIYYSGAVAQGFPVTVNVGVPNDPGRLFNPFIPGSRKKEWTSLKRAKASISYLQFLGKRK